jgi:hypothetical protein
MAASQVVVRYRDGRLLKGTTSNFAPAREGFHVQTPAGENVAVRQDELKALFFVRDLSGSAGRSDVLALVPGDDRARGAFPIELEFADGERFVGLTVRYPPIRPFFFVLPADSASNNVRILVNRAAVKRMSQPPPPAA